MTIGLCPHSPLFPARRGSGRSPGDPDTARRPRPRAGRRAGDRRDQRRRRGVRHPRRDAALGGARALPGADPRPARPRPGRSRRGSASLRGLEGIGAEVESAAGRRGLLRGRRPARASGDRVARTCWRRPQGRSARAVRLARRPDPLLRLRRREHARPPRGAGAVVDPGAAASADFLAPLPVSLLDGRLRDECTPARRTAGRRRSSGSGSRRSAISPGCRGSPSPTASGRSGCAPTTSPPGGDTPLRPRRPHEELVQAIGPARGRLRDPARSRARAADRAARSPTRAGTDARSARCGSRPGSPAAAAGGPRWRCAAPTTSPRAAAAGAGAEARAGCRPRPPTLALRALELGPGGRDQPALARTTRPRGAASGSAEAVRQARAAAGRDAVLRVLDVEPGSRIPERRAMLAQRRERGMSRRRLYAPRPRSTGRAAVSARRLHDVGRRGRVEAIREEWLVEDRWWTSAPLRRHYFELVLATAAA